ncbi:MAG TPA: hypothetical protein VKV32_01465 [Stellaceae bacterium]|nr:hypothetical protein [Stellaceae bacterium]
MQDRKYWQLRASEMRERASHIKDAAISNGFLALAAQYDELAAGEARWVKPGLDGATLDAFREPSYAARSRVRHT